MANTPKVTVRIPNELWDKAGRRAKDEGTTRTALIIGWLEDYTNEDRTVTTELAEIMSKIKAVRTRLVPEEIGERE